MDWVEIETLKPNPKNPNKHSKEQIKRLSEIIQYQGWRHPIIVSKNTGYIAAGHGRLEAAKLLGQKTVPVSIQEFTDEDQEKAFLVSDNAIASWAELDLSSINSEIGTFSPDFDINLLGIENFVLEPADKYGDKDADQIPESRETSIKMGDLFKIGDHRLLCGDSTMAEQVARLMNGEKADMVFTDPPYNLQENGKKQHSNKGGTAKRTDFGWWDEGFSPKRAIENILSQTKPDVFVFICTSSFLFGDVNKLLLDAKGDASYLVWCKNNPMPSLQKSTYLHSTELICYARFGRAAFNYPAEGNLTNYFTGNVESHSEGHPTQKPTYVPEYCINHASKLGGLVLDLFLGSGSTLIACEKTNRKCYGMEIDPQYCQVIIDRWEKFTGKKAEKLD